jgi:hypothetical protein
LPIGGLAMANTEFVVEFAEHLKPDQIASMVTGMAAYGNIHERSTPRSFEVPVFRASNVPRLRQKLVTWERYGFLNWRDAIS